jgi:hypothetical protein
MLDVIKDSLKKKVDGREFTVVYLMPFGRVGFLGLTKLNLAHVAKQSPEDSEAIADAIKPLAYAMCLVSNNMDRINELDAFLKGQSAKDVNFYRKVFEVALPPIAKLNYEIIKECFEAEVEVLRSL